MALPLVQKCLNNPIHGLPEEVHARNNPLTKLDMHFEFPVNFAEVVDGIYRSAFPQPKNFSALHNLRLKAIITLVDEPYTAAHDNFIQENNITHHRIILPPHKDAKVRVPEPLMRRILQILLDPTNHPVLVHCNKGKHRTGCVIACLRKAQNWPPADVIAEYRKYSYPKNRSLDENFILDFDISNVARLAYENDASSWSSSESGSALANSRLRRPSSAFGSSVML